MAAKRILSIDILRGLTIALMIVVNTPGSWSYVYAPLLHAKWHGCTPTDLVFPSFLFVVGLSMSISMRKFTANQRYAIVIKVIKRATLIFIIGLLLNWFPFIGRSFAELRIFGVLQRIALSFLGAGIIVAFFSKIKPLLIICIALLLGHWGLLYGLGGSDPYSLEGNISGSIDIWLLGKSHVYKGFGIRFDPEGLMGTITGVAHVLLGFILGKYTIKDGSPSLPGVRNLLYISAGLIVGALIWDFFLPINKPLWTSSYVLYTCGIVSAFWAILILLVDFQKWTRWAFPFQVFGQNPLFSYVLSIVIVKLYLYIFKVGDQNLYAWLYSQIYQPVFGNYAGSFLFALSMTAMVWLVALYLYRRKIIIKV